jgi:hypothetical protein
MQIAGRNRDNRKILVFLLVVCFLSLIALAAIELLFKRPSGDGSDAKTASGGRGNNGQTSGAGSGSIAPVANAGSGNATAGDATSTGTTNNTGSTTPPVAGVPEPLDRPPHPAIKAELVRTYIETFVREHTMLDTVIVSELSGNYFPPNTQLLAVHVHGVSVTMDFSIEILAYVHQPEVFDQWQKELIVGIYEVAPTLANFHVRVMDEKANLRPLNDFIKIPPEKKPRDR